MAITPACAGIALGSVSSYHTPTCMSTQLCNRRSVFVRHLGSRPALSTRESLAARKAQLRSAVPRQGRLQCQAFKSQTEVTPKLCSQCMRSLSCVPLNRWQNAPGAYFSEAKPLQKAPRNGWTAKDFGKLASSCVLWCCIVADHSSWRIGFHRWL